MTTKIYETNYVKLINGTTLLVTPLKIFYLRQFMDEFDNLEKKDEDADVLTSLIKCSLIAMSQYYPKIETIEELEDSIDMQNMYKLIEYCSGIKMKQEANEPQEPSIPNNSKTSNTWETLDLAKLESEVFLLGIWKDYEDLEKSLSLPELFATLEAKRDLDYQDKKFTASLKGIDLDEASGQTNEQEDAWEAMKARVAARESGIGNGDPNDITALQGVKAQQAGFGIGMGLDYEVVKE